MKTHSQQQTGTRFTWWLALALLAVSPCTALADNLYWDANGTTAGAGSAPSGTWGTDSFWNTDSTGADGGAFRIATTAVDSLFFVAGPSADSGNSNFTVALSGNQEVISLTFQSSASNITLGDALTSISLSGGISVVDKAYGSTNAGGATINSNLVLQGSQTFSAIRSPGLTINGAISGTGNLLLSGNGPKFFNSANSYVGTTTLNNSTNLTLGGTAGSVGTGDVIINNTFAVLTFNHSGDYTFANNITGAGATNSVNKIGSNMLTLTGNNTYTSGTQIANGTLRVSSIATNLGSGSVLRLGGSSNTGRLLYTGVGETVTRQLSLSGTTGGGIIENTGSGALKFTGTFGTNGVGAKTLTLQGSNTDANEIEGVIIDSGTGSNRTSVAKSQGGTWILSGNNTYTGSTTVNAGLLIIDGDQSAATGAMTINDTGTLGGSGILGGTLTLNGGGTLAPGNSAGTLTGTTLNWGSEGVLDFELGATSDLLNLSGGFNEMLEGGVYNFHFADAGGLGLELYTLVNFTSTTFEAGSDFGFTTDIAGLEGNFLLNAGNLQFQVTAVPESAALALVGLGLLALGGRRRR